MNKKALVAMSGGVDLGGRGVCMAEVGYDCVGATMKLFNKDCGTCGSAQEAEDAHGVAQQLGFDHHVYDSTVLSRPMSRGALQPPAWNATAI